MTGIQFSQLNDSEKIEYVKMCYREGIVLTFSFVTKFAEAGGRDIIPFLFGELLKHEFHDYRDRRYEQLSFIIETLIYFRDTNVLTLYERYYAAAVLEGKILNYIKQYRRYDPLVMGINTNIWMFFNTNYAGQLANEIDEIIIAKYRTMGLLE